jgi:hypothetical protein
MTRYVDSRVVGRGGFKPSRVGQFKVVSPRGETHIPQRLTLCFRKSPSGLTSILTRG